jgi:hypothetical protein
VTESAMIEDEDHLNNWLSQWCVKEVKKEKWRKFRRYKSSGGEVLLQSIMGDNDTVERLPRVRFMQQRLMWLCMIGLMIPWHCGTCPQFNVNFEHSWYCQAQAADQTTLISVKKCQNKNKSVQFMSETFHHRMRSFLSLCQQPWLHQHLAEITFS